jgi:Zn-dependent M28 family amino/carboxypeptidase
LFINERDQFEHTTTSFNGNRAFRDVEHQLAFGPRIPGSEGHRLFVEWLVNELIEEGWETSKQETILMDQRIINLISRKGSGEYWIVIGAHYDTRIFADNDLTPANRILPVPGANDGASGVAVLLEIARILPDEIPFELWLVFFDAEDNAGIEGWNPILGSRKFVEELTAYPDAMILVDMVGDKNLNIHMEKYSDPLLTQEIWDTAADLGYSNYFIPTTKYAIYDDHIPFLQAGIPAVNIIDFDYEFWHTVEDTSNKISPDSLSIVGNTLLTWLESYK